MPRFFVPIELLSPEQIDVNASDMTRVFAINELEHGFEVALTLFDFTIDFDGRANNRINTHRDLRPRIDGFLINVLKVGSKTREVNEQEYLQLYRSLEAKAAHMKSHKRRKLVRSESFEKENRLQLPS